MLFPLPSALHHICHIVLAVPAKELVGTGAVRVNGRDIAWTTVAEYVVQLVPDHLLRCIQHFQHGKAVATTKIEDLATICVFAFYEIVHSFDMGIRDVANVQVVADARAVAGVVVGTEDSHLR